jgi:hypothetical protein
MDWPRLSGERNEEGKGEVYPNRTPDPEEGARVAIERLEEIHQYLRDREARREVITRTVTPSGQELDWSPSSGRFPKAGWPTHLPRIDPTCSDWSATSRLTGRSSARTSFYSSS